MQGLRHCISKTLYFIIQVAMEIMAPKPDVLCSTRSSITLSWGNTDDESKSEDRNDVGSRYEYTLQIKDRIRGWIPVYW